MTSQTKGLIFVTGIALMLAIGAVMLVDTALPVPAPAIEVVPPDRPVPPPPPDPLTLRIDSLTHVIDSLKTKLYVREK